ncbi:hypothetical protein RBE51_17880 [Pseudomonas taiwanensis]|uniref:hypothetical protein n=1 Tax=Pseudomonas taiwanensis TaxID=470150 RepID=UPI0028DDA370|nr:hypothetical protein [Pseudomonas taiwanensis]MDT8924681.1 hypothetical protein [Pseudomonas taiwanensis]
MTYEEADEYTRQSSRLSARISEHYNAFGCTNLPLIDAMLDTDQASVELFFNNQSWGYYPKTRHLPFMIAVLHDFSARSLAEIVRTFDIDPIEYIADIDYNDEKIPSVSGQRVDGRVLASKMVEAFEILDPQMARMDFNRNFNHSGVALAYIAAGNCSGVANALMESEFKRAQSGDFDGGQPLQFDISELAIYVDHPEHLPNRSTVEFLEKAGAWSPHVVKKTLYQNACWESMLASRRKDSYSFQRKMLDEVVSPLNLSVNGDKVRMMLSNITMDTTDQDHDYHSMVEDVLGWIKNTPLHEYAGKVTFGLSLTRNYLRFSDQPVKPQDLFCGDPATGPHCLELQALFVGKGRRLLQAVIDETLEMPDDHIGFHHLSVPYILRKLDLPRQLVKKGSFEAYLTKLARVGIAFQMEGDVPEYKSMMDTMIDEGIRHWIREISKTMPMDAKRLDLHNDAIADHLVRWGLDISLIPEPTDKSLSASLERDIGL